MRNQRHFQRGGSPTFTCQACERGTRITTQPEGCGFCGECYEISSYQNCVYDGETPADVLPRVQPYLNAITKRGGNLAAVRAYFPALFERN